MTVATVLVVVFMYWLYVESSQIESTTVAADTTEAGLPTVSDSVFAQAPERFSGRRILLTAVPVAEPLGRASFTLELPARTGYPAILERSLIEQEIRVVGGDNVDIAGSVYALNDSIINVWGQRGVFSRENREKLGGQETFFLVDSLDFVFPGEEPSEGGQEAGS
jgi:hypothetical protein